MDLIPILVAVETCLAVGFLGPYLLLLYQDGHPQKEASLAILCVTMIVLGSCLLAGPAVIVASDRLKSRGRSAVIVSGVVILVGHVLLLGGCIAVGLKLP